MRRFALLGLTLLLPACQSTVGNPFEGFGGFLGDTHSVRLNPNRPAGASENLRRAMGQDVELQPLTPEPGDIWPGPVQPTPTLQDIQREAQRMGQEPGPQRPARGSSTPPGPGPGPLPPVGNSPAPEAPNLPPASPPRSQAMPAPPGSVVGSEMGNGVQTYTDPRGQIGIIVPNGNGTSTLIAPDGTVTVVPNRR